jgi:hypothetical protein
VSRIRAVIVSPRNADTAQTVACLNHCTEREYELVGVMADGVKAVDMLKAGTIDAVVTVSEELLPPDYPRVEVIGEPRRRPRNEIRGRGTGSSGNRHRGLL